MVPLALPAGCPPSKDPLFKISEGRPPRSNRTRDGEGVKKLLLSTFIPKGRVDFQSFRMRSLRLRVTRHGNKDMWLSELTAQWFNFQRLRSKASPIHPSFPFEPSARFFHTFGGVTFFLTSCCLAVPDESFSLLSIDLGIVYTFEIASSCLGFARNRARMNPNNAARAMSMMETL